MIAVAGTDKIHKIIWYYLRTLFKENIIIVVVDATNRFDPYLISYISVKMGLNPYEVLENIYVARAFTPFQMLELLKKVLNFIQKKKKFVFILLGITTLLDDDNISNIQAMKVLKKSLYYLSKIKSPIITLNSNDRRNMFNIVKQHSFIFIEHNTILKPEYLMEKGAIKLWEGQLHLLHTL